MIIGQTITVEGKKHRVAGNAVNPLLSEESHFCKFFGTTNSPQFYNERKYISVLGL